MKDYIQIRINKNTLNLLFWILSICISLVICWYFFYGSYQYWSENAYNQGYKKGWDSAINETLFKLEKYSEVKICFNDNCKECELPYEFVFDYTDNFISYEEDFELQGANLEY